MGNGPEKEKDGKSACERAHEIGLQRSCVWAGSEHHHEQPVQQQHQRRARGMRDLQFIGCGDEFPAIPEASRSLPRHNIDNAGYDAHDPASDVVRFPEIHTRILRLRQK